MEGMQGSLMEALDDIASFNKKMLNICTLSLYFRFDFSFNHVMLKVSVQKYPLRGVNLVLNSSPLKLLATILNILKTLLKLPCYILTQISLDFCNKCFIY